jgi:hypothetical protein
MQIIRIASKLLECLKPAYSTLNVIFNVFIKTKLFPTNHGYPIGVKAL